jgi:hypothetical protein
MVCTIVLALVVLAEGAMRAPRSEERFMQVVLLKALGGAHIAELLRSVRYEY